MSTELVPSSQASALTTGSRFLLPAVIADQGGRGYLGWRALADGCTVRTAPASGLGALVH